MREVEVLRSADAFVLPSYSKGLPVATRSEACGGPVVVTPNCNLPNVAIAEAGWIVEATVEGVLGGLRWTMASADERRRLGLNGRHLVARRYTCERIAADSLGL